MTGVSTRPKKPVLWRAVLFQTALVAFLGLIAFELIGNVIDNLARLSIVSGFDFLGRKSGFSIIQTLIPYSEQSTYGRVFVVGLLNTLLVAVLGIIIASVLGFALGIARLSRNWMVRTLARSYVEIMRNIPLLLHLFFWYFAVLQLLPEPRQSLELGAGVFLNIRGLYLPGFAIETGSSVPWLAVGFAMIVVYAHRCLRLTVPGSAIVGFLIGCGVIVAAIVMGFMTITTDVPTLKGFNFHGGISLIPELAALLLALSLYTAAYIAEIVRAGILAVPEGQAEAARALGMNSRQTLSLVTIPLALRVIVPPLTSQYLNLTKNSSLAVAIAYPDLVSVFTGTALNQTGQAVEILTMTLAVYLALSLFTSAFMNWFNAHITFKGAGYHV